MTTTAAWSMPAATSNTSLGTFLENDVFPRLSAEQVYTHNTHRFQKSPTKWRGGCPWHDSDSGTSFVVTPETLQWYCAGCHEGGHVLEYLAKLAGRPLPLTGEDFINTVRQVANIAGVPFPEREQSPEDHEKARLQDVRRAVLEWTIKDAQKRLWSEKGALPREYLHQRGLTDDQIKDLRLGLFGNAQFMRQELPEHYERDDVNKAKVIVSLMDGYITFPWMDAYGRPLTLYGRWPGDPPSSKPKTTALPGEGTKRSPLYFDRARTDRHNSIVLVEGVIDAAVAQARGMTNVVACVAAQLGYAQVDTLQRHKVQDVVICLDPDSAGEGGILSCINSLDTAGIASYVAPRLPDGLDPDEFILRYEIDAFREHVGSAVHAYRYKAQTIIGERCPSTDAEKSKALTEARAFAEQHVRNPDHIAAFFWPVMEQALGLTPGMASEASTAGEGATLEHFRAYMPEHRYIFMPIGEIWPASSVNNRLPSIPTGSVKENGKDEFIAASVWLDKHRPVEQMTWAPGEPQLIQDRLVSHGGWIEHGGATVFNLYRPPRIGEGDPRKALHWINHLEKIYGDHAEHIIKWLAHRIQFPGDKINHALVLGGPPGIGKDTALEPVKHGVGPWNFQEVSPGQLLGRFNGFVKSVILRISEARDLGDIDRYSFYEHLKVYTAAPPDVIRVDEKNRNEYAVFNVCGVIITTNHKTSGMYLPADDRRHYVAWSELESTNFPREYFPFLYRWFAAGGTEHVAAYLREYDLSGFDAKAPPPKTAAFWDIVAANQAPEDAGLADVLDVLGNPNAVSIAQIISKADQDFRDWLKDRKNSRAIPHRFEALGYVRVRNDQVKDGQWIVAGKRQAVYARAELDPRDRIAAARELANYGYLEEVA